MKRLLTILFILGTCLLHAQTYDSTNGIIFKGDGSVKHSHSAYLNVGSLTFTLADSNKFIQLSPSGTFTLVESSVTFSLPDTTGHTGEYLQVLAGGGFTWDSPASGSIPAGVITMWSGSVGTIPIGWVLCDGTNGTPDLRDRFIIGAGGNYAVDAIGGSNSFTPSGANSTPLFTGTPATITHAGTAVGNHSNHTHTFGTIAVGDHSSHTHTYTQVVNHVHIYASLTSTSGSVSSYEHGAIDASSTAAEASISTNNPTGGVATGTTNGPGAILTHSVSGSTANESATQTHSVTQPNDHSYTPVGTVGKPVFTGIEASTIPYYYSLCYIMKQ